MIAVVIDSSLFFIFAVILQTICASNIGIFLNDKNREYEILSSTSLEIDLFDNHATFVSVNKLNIELCLETINALILILKGISSRNSRKVRNIKIHDLLYNSFEGV